MQFRKERGGRGRAGRREEERRGGKEERREAKKGERREGKEGAGEERGKGGVKRPQTNLLIQLLTVSNSPPLRTNRFSHSSDT